MKKQILNCNGKIIRLYEADYESLSDVIEECAEKQISLRGAYLKDVNLEDCVLENVDLREANLIGAKFNGSNCYNANFTGAILRTASFKGADIRCANFTGADVRFCNMTYAKKDAAIFGGAQSFFRAAPKGNASSSLNIATSYLCADGEVITIDVPEMDMT
jgi:Uncharacterized low-complexity proteins